ncbi:hypothetical protein GCM10009753_41450 [Streptantibioticus ferralitis]
MTAAPERQAHGSANPPRACPCPCLDPPDRRARVDVTRSSECLDGSRWPTKSHRECLRDFPRLARITARRAVQVQGKVSWHMRSAGNHEYRVRNPGLAGSSRP